MKFKELYKNDLYYSVGVDEHTGRVIEGTVTGVAWIDYDFWLSPEEFQAFQADQKALDALRNGCWPRN